MNESERQYHDVSNIFPMMSDEEFDALKQDIKAQGLLEPIWIHADGSIIDGRNRHRACVELGVTPLFRTYQGENPVAFSISQNIKRRHLTDSQRAMIAVQALPMLQAEAKAKMIASGAKGGDGRGNKKNPGADLPQGFFYCLDHLHPSLQMQSFWLWLLLAALGAPVLQSWPAGYRSDVVV